MRKTIGASQWVENNIDVKVLFKNVLSSLREISLNDAEEGQMVAYVTDVVSGSFGQFQGKAIAELFGFEDIEEEDLDTLWMEIDNFAQEISQVIDEKIVAHQELINQEPRLSGTIYFGTLEADNCYGIFYSIEEEEYRRYLQSLE